MARRTMRLFPALIALSVVVVLSARTAGHDNPPKADPMAGFARLVSDEWRQTAQSGQSMFHTWHWGPGKHSIRRMTDGTGAGGDPWREVQVIYWHPGLKQVRLLGMSPYARGVSEGTIRFGGESAEGFYDLHQTKGLRKMGLRWAFNGSDKYRETLLEAGPDGLKPLVDLDHVRTKPTPRTRSVVGEKPSARLKVLEPLLGAWEGKGKWVGSDAFQTKTTFEWVPLADAIYARVAGQDGEHLLDAYLYHHTGADVLRGVALTKQGGVYEGDIGARAGSLIIDLKGHDGVQHTASFDFEKDGTLRQRVINGTDRQLDVHHKKLSPKKG